MSCERWGLDAEAVLALNLSEEVATSPLDHDDLEALLSEAFFAAGVDGGRDAFVIAFDRRAKYESPNFQWFCNNIDGREGGDFLYIDRIIVAASARKRGLARQLYDDVAKAARAAGGVGKIVCEVNVDPPNPVSDAFHEALGFVEVGRALLANGKTVRYMQLDLK